MRVMSMRPAKASTREAFAGLLLILPAAVAILAFVAYPFAQGIRWSFTDLYLLRSLDQWRYIGLENYTRLFNDPKTALLFRNTALWVVGSLVTQLIFGFALALLLHRRVVLRPFFRAIVLVPWVTPPVVAALIWRWILHEQWGVLNNVLMALGLIARPVAWLSDQTLVWASLLIMGMWRHFPFWYVNILAGLQMIPVELYDVAQIDGANRWRTFWHVTLPQLRPVLSVLLLLETVWRANEFAMIWAVTEGGPGDQTTTLALFTYMTTFKFYRIGYGASAGVVLLLILTVFTILYVRKVRFDI